MWPSRSHALVLLTIMTSNRGNLLTYPDFNETFDIHTDASAFRLGAVISHKGETIAFYSRKLNGSQQRCTVK